jgi:hypothetical protein
MTELDDVLDAIARAEAERALRQVAVDQALEHRDHLIRDAADLGADNEIVAKTANLSVVKVDSIIAHR